MALAAAVPDCEYSVQSEARPWSKQPACWNGGGLVLQSEQATCLWGFVPTRFSTPDERFARGVTPWQGELRCWAPSAPRDPSGTRRVRTVKPLPAWHSGGWMTSDAGMLARAVLVPAPARGCDLSAWIGPTDQPRTVRRPFPHPREAPLPPPMCSCRRLRGTGWCTSDRIRPIPSDRTCWCRTGRCR